MSSDLPPELQRLLDSTLQQPEAQQLGFLERHCDDPELRRRAMAWLLETRTSGPGRFPTRGEVAATLGAELTRDLQIDGFDLERQIGVGGMSVVWAARQLQPPRPVAVKFLAYGPLSERARQRFEREQELLARLQHPGIAQIHTAGVVRSGERQLPFFAMELVDGACDIVTHARRHGLSARARIELFLQVCAAVQHGHQKAVLHLDLKPSNVLVDSEGRVRIIDFGIGRALDASLAAGRSTQEIIGTPAYMSPESVTDPTAVDTRTDVYSLGVVLFELMTGEVPLADEVTPIWSPGRNAAMANAIARAARKELPHGFEWVIRKACEPEREDRYASVSELAADVRRASRGEPTSAGPGSFSEALMRFVWRHRRAVALLAGAVLITTLFIRTVMASGQHAEERDRVTGLLESFVGALELDAYLIDRRLGAVLIDTLDKSLGTAAIDDPSTQARLRIMQGRVLLSLGELEAARSNLEQAYSIATDDGVADGAVTFPATLAFAQWLWSAGELARAETLLRQALAIATVEQAVSTRVLLADLLLQRHDLKAARALLGRSDRSGAEAPDARPHTLKQLCHEAAVRARLSMAEGDFAAAEQQLNSALTALQAAGHADEHPAFLRIRSEQFAMRLQQGALEESAAISKSLLPALRKTFGESHWVTLQAVANDGELARRMQDPATAAARFQTVIRDGTTPHMETNAAVLQAVNGLAVMAIDGQQPEEAIAIIERHLDVDAIEWSATGMAQARLVETLGIALAATFELERAIALLRPTVSWLEEHLGPDDAQIHTVRFRLAQALRDHGDDAGALEQALINRAALERAGQLPGMLGQLTVIAACTFRARLGVDLEAAEADARWLL
ncbi:MAG: protein kinase, partial [Planctomycetes bacterium]|nr:protein kinase [Planctomycetota bacterium]